jgi:hypothetical protein
LNFIRITCVSHRSTISRPRPTSHKTVEHKILSDYLQLCLEQFRAIYASFILHTYTCSTCLPPTHLHLFHMPATHPFHVPATCTHSICLPPAPIPCLPTLPFHTPAHLLPIPHTCKPHLFYSACLHPHLFNSASCTLTPFILHIYTHSHLTLQNSYPDYNIFLNSGYCTFPVGSPTSTNLLAYLKTCCCRPAKA